MMMSRTLCAPLVVLLLSSCTLSVSARQQQDVVEYGVDCSFAMHYKTLQCDWHKDLYENYMQGCREYAGKEKAHLCDETEDERIKQARYQPSAMTNYTSTGYRKIRAPERLRKLLAQHWEANQNTRQKEEWPKGDIYLNHWTSPTYMVSVEDGELEGAGEDLQKQVWDAAKSTIEEWTGMEQSPTSLYGIRVYTEGAILSPHVDRLPLVSSCIVNVAQDVDEPWPLEVIDRQGRAVNVTMEPGDMVLYESGSLIHSRPFPLKGRYFANIFIHFEPTGRLMNESSSELDEEKEEGFYPPYLDPNSDWAEEWANEHPSGWKRPGPSAPDFSPTTSDTDDEEDMDDLREAAADGDLELLKELIAEDEASSVHDVDDNGWNLLHEAVREGHVDVARYLIQEHGADKNALEGSGSSVLNLALEYHDDNAPIVQYLESIGAEDIGPDDEL